MAIARALVFDPELVLMDEPLGALDRRLREEMQYEIRRIQRTLGITVVYVTHDQQEAMVMSDRVAVFRGGAIEQVASPEVLYEEPERAFVAHFIGENNRLNGVVRTVGDGVCEVEVGDALIKAVSLGQCPPGAAATVVVRPERVNISLGEGRHSYANEFDAECRGYSISRRSYTSAPKAVRTLGLHRQDPQRRGPWGCVGGRSDPRWLDHAGLPRAGTRCCGRRGLESWLINPMVRMGSLGMRYFAALSMTGANPWLLGHAERSAEELKHLYGGQCLAAHRPDDA